MARRHLYQRNSDQPIAITPIEYSGLQEAFDHFNVVLFDGGLPDVFITYQRKAHSFGYFSPDRFSGRVGKWGKHELALNPDGFIDQSDEQVCQTLVHELVHVWQHAFGKPSGRGYHNKEWAAKMKAIGLQPSSTGMVGGKETGQRMADYIIPGGAFTKAYAKLAADGWKLNLQSAARPGPKGGTNSKTKFTCPTCGQNAWGKPDLEILCTHCFMEQHADIQLDYQRARMLAAIPAAEISYPIIDEPVQAPVKPARGRPRGSKNKSKARTKGSKNKPKLAA
jgi:SprT-like family